MQKNRFISFLFLCKVLLFINGCKQHNSDEQKISSMKLKVKIERFEKKFKLIDTLNINKLKGNYSFFFPGNYSDSFWIKKKDDSAYKLLEDSVSKEFADIKPIENELTHFFKHLKNQFPSIIMPRVISLINNVDYQNNVILADSLLLISLDCFMGADHHLYKGIPLYVKKNMNKHNLTSKVVEEYAKYIIDFPKDRSFLSKMVYHGKLLYIKDILMPHHEDSLKIGYTRDQNKWVNENEVFIWQYMIEKQILFSTKTTLDYRFLMPAPFSKFYLEIDNDSPGRIGQWIGWQIVKSYKDEFPDSKLQEILSMPSQDLFNKSKYKPRRIWK